MEDLTSKTVAVFSRPFTVRGFGETLPAGEYEIETELAYPPSQFDPESWKACVPVKLHPRTTHPGLARTLTVSLADLDQARARDKLTGRTLSDFFLEEMLADPIVRLVMEADGVSEVQMCHLYSGFLTPRPENDAPGSTPLCEETGARSAIQAAENKGMPHEPQATSPPRRRLGLDPA